MRLKVDVILARASSGAMAAKRATTSIPIVFFAVYAPVEIGLVPSLGHPGGNITGVAVNASDMAGKRLQMLKELVPTLKRVAMLSHPPHPTNAVQLQGAETAARTSGRAARSGAGARRGRFCVRAQGSTRHRRFAARRYPTLRHAPCSTRRRGGREPAARDIFVYGYTSRLGASCRTVRNFPDLYGPRRRLRGQDLEGREAR